jgi:S-adenosylmethionine/arginine decarboxylase-like enzyme
MLHRNSVLDFATVDPSDNGNAVLQEKALNLIESRLAAKNVKVTLVVAYDDGDKNN